MYTACGATMLIDAHTHLDHYDVSLGADVLTQIERLRMLTVAVATDPPSWEHAQAVAGRSQWIIPTFGIHPWKAADYAGRWALLAPLIEQSPMLGEIGLDFHWVEDRSTYVAQHEVFEFFLQAAQEQHKIVNLHTKGAETEVLASLTAHAIERAIVHWYSGPPDIAQRLVERGAYFTFGVELDYSEHIQALATHIPLTQLLTETDGPTGLEWLGGGTAMPQHIADVVSTLARLRGVEDAEMRQIIWQNARRLFGDDERWRTWTRLMDMQV